tara:strand:- start:80 stop:1171 length:1092 start_codon:yes stop_codon:yes gene_type:complete
MKIIGSVKEDLSFEKRVSITPETVKKFVDLGFSINLEKQYAEHIGISDKDFEKNGANINFSKKEIYEKSEIILKVNFLSEDEISLVKSKSIFVAQFDPNSYKEEINKLIKNNIKIFSLNLLPRITRAQSMDVLSSQANLAGYKAVIESFSKFEKAVPMMMTAAGTVPAAKVLVIGAGVAGLQAIATAKRMGAIVSVTDVRITAKEQVESLGGRFLMVEDSENLETEGGYAKEASEEFKKKQEDLLSETLKKIDIVICTALIPGKKAPLIIKENMIKNMKPGTLIFDLAASQGGNAAFTQTDKIIDKNGVKIIGERNILNKLPISASNLYAKNLFNFVLNLYDKENKKVNINLEDEIIEKTLIK